MNARPSTDTPLRVLYVIDSLAPGGAELSLAAMAPELIRRGVQLDVVTLTVRPGVQGVLREAGATVTELRGSRATWWRQIRSLTRQRRPDLVHTTLFEADLAGRLGARAGGTRVVSTLANDTYGPAHQDEPTVRMYKLRGAQLADALTARLTTRLHSLSAHVADVMAKRLRYPRHRIDVIPRGRDPDALGRLSASRRERTRARLGFAMDKPLVIAVARHEHQKGLDLLIEALPAIEQRCPGTRLVVAGRTGAATARLREMQRDVAPEHTVEFLGARDDVPDLLCAADVFVFPSRREGFGGALLEAMALECPAVVSDLPQTRELVDEETAWITTQDDPEALAGAVADALSNREMARRRAAAARRRFIARFTIEAVADEMLCFYRRVVKRPGERSIG